MPPAEFIGEEDLRQIFSDAFTAFSPLAALVGADATRSLSNHVSNKKQLLAVSLAPIGALGIMSTICKGTNMTAVKDLLGTGENDILDCAAELSCGSLRGVVPLFSKRGGLTCYAKSRNAGIAASAIIRARWCLGCDTEDELDFQELSRFLDTIHMSTVSGRIEWRCSDYQSHIDVAAQVQALILESWDGRNSAWNRNLLSDIQKSEHPVIRTGHGAIELHWPTPSMPLEQTSLIVFVFITTFIVVPVAFIILATTSLLGWQTPRASAMLLGGQIVLSLGRFMAQWVLALQRTSAYIDLPRRHFSDHWMLVDNTWFTGMMARRRVSYNPLSPSTMTIGQHVTMGSFIPAWQALLVMLCITGGFLSFYIGARSSHLYVVLFQIAIFFFANLLKGYVISVANDTYMTPLNNPGYADAVRPPLEPWTWKRALKYLQRYLQPPNRPHEASPETELEQIRSPVTAVKVSADEKKATSIVEVSDARSSCSTTPGTRIPLPPSVDSLMRPQSVASSSRVTGGRPSLEGACPVVPLPHPPSGKTLKLIDYSDDPPIDDTVANRIAEQRKTPSKASSIASSFKGKEKVLEDPEVPSEPRELSDGLPFDSSKVLVDLENAPDNFSHVPAHLTTEDAQGKIPKTEKTQPPDDPIPITDTHQHRVYAKIALRRSDAIGLFYFSVAQIWSAAAHVIYEALHDQIQWAPHMRKEPLLVLPFDFFDPSTGPSHGSVSATLVLALDETINEDVFWMAGMELVTILCGAFTDSERLVSEYPDSTNAHLVGAYVMYVTKLILLAYTTPDPNDFASTLAGDGVQGQHGGGEQVATRQTDRFPGVASMMRAIDLVRRKYPFDSSVFAVPLMRQYARAAVDSLLRY